MNLNRIRIPNPILPVHTSLDHEKLEVYQASLDFITWTIPLLDGLPGSASVRNQLDRASTSIPLNIAEGNGKFTSPDRCRFFDRRSWFRLGISCMSGCDGGQKLRQHA